MSVKDKVNSKSKIFSKVVQFCYDRPFFGYALIICLVFWPLSLGIYALQYDAIDVYLPWRFFGSEVLMNGEVPLWNPFQDGGYPFYADHQYSLWNPEFFIVSLFGRYSALTVQWLYLLYIVFGGLGFRYLLKQLGLSVKVSFYGGILFMLSGIMIGYGQSVISILGAVWLPWSLGAYIKLLKDNFRIKDLLRCIICLFLMLAAGYQAVSIMLFYVLLTFAIYQLIVLFKAKDWAKMKRFVLGHAVLGIFVGILLLGTVVSLIEVTPYLTRLSGVSIADTQKSIFHPKALFSLLYPMASVHQEIPGMSISTLNVFSGTVALFFLLFVRKNYREKHSPQLFILLVFGLVYGLASFGPDTFVQPLFAKYVPGCNLFFYAVFYRFFAWIALLILSCIGFDYFLKKGKSKYVLYFFVSLVAIYGISMLVSWGAWDEVNAKWTPNWSVTFRDLSRKASVLVQSLIHVFIAGVFAGIYFLTKHKKGLLSIFLVTELMVISQLNIPITVHGNTRTATIDNYLSTKKSGISLPNEYATIGSSEIEGQYGPIWRNQGNFTNLPALNGWTSFHLADREEAYINHEERTKELMQKPFAYVKSGEGTAKLIEFESNEFKVEFKGATKLDTLVVQQAKYPGWEARVNGYQTNIFKGNVFEQHIPISGDGTVFMRFNNDTIRVLFYTTHLGFILLLIIFILVAWKPSRKWLPYGFATIAIVFVSVRLYQYAFAEQAKTSLVLESKGRTLREFSTRLNYLDKHHVISSISMKGLDTISFREQNLDLDLDILAAFNHNYRTLVEVEMDNRSTYMTFADSLTTKKARRSQWITMDSSKIYVNNDKHLGWPALTQDMRILTAKIDREKQSVLSEEKIVLVVEVTRNGTQTFYQTRRLGPYWKGKERCDYKGILLPKMSSADDLKVYLWNSTGEPFTFSRFELGYVDLDR